MKKAWLFYAMAVTVLWGVWGALIEIPEKKGFPATLGYSVWALTMVPVAFLALGFVGWQLDRRRRSVLYGLSAGLLGCGGQLVLFECLRIGPAYIVFPIISLYPVVTISLSVLFLGERATRRAWTGIALALIAMVMLSYQPAEGSPVRGFLWLILAIGVFVMWGVQAYIMKFIGDASREDGVNAESIVVYTMLSAVALAPVALAMTDFSGRINWGLSGAWSAAMIQGLNAVGFLFFAYAIRYGKAIIVVPMMSLAPVVTVLLSLALYAVIPHPVIASGMVLALVAIYLLSE